MRRYWVESSALSKVGDQLYVNFRDEVFHHIFSVCRQEVGSKFEVLTGDGKAHLLEVESVTKKSASGRVFETRTIPALPKPHLHLVLSIPRFPVMEAVIEKAVELGVHSVHPVFSDYSFVRKDSSLPDNKVDRWHKIVISATQQSGRGELMQILPVTDLLSAISSINRTKGQLGLFAYEGLADLSVKAYLRSQLAASATEEISEVWVFVGSEGGFSTQEVQEFQQVGLQSVSLGEQVLRVETACIALLAVLKYEFAMS